MGGRSPSDFYFCESCEAETVLVKAGYGISTPGSADSRIPSLIRIPVAGLEPLSFGAYYKTLQETRC